MDTGINRADGIETSPGEPAAASPPATRLQATRPYNGAIQGVYTLDRGENQASVLAANP